MTMAGVWLRIAGLILDEEYSGPYICNLANMLRRANEITREQHAAVMAAVSEERERQDVSWPDWPGGAVLWRDVWAQSEEGRTLRIQFCTEQIRRLMR